MSYLPQLYWLERRLCNLRCSDGEHQKLTARLNQHADIVNACRMETRTDKSKVTTTTKGSNKTDLHELSTVQEGEPALSAWEPPLIANMHIRTATVTEAMVRLDKISHDNTSRSAAKCRLYKFPSNCVDARCELCLPTQERRRHLKTSVQWGFSEYPIWDTKSMTLWSMSATFMWHQEPILAKIKCSQEITRPFFMIPWIRVDAEVDRGKIGLQMWKSGRIISSKACLPLLKTNLSSEPSQILSINQQHNHSWNGSS